MERRSLCRSFSSVVPEPNTFIGSGGVTSASNLASKTSLSESNISNFNIDADGNVWCYIDASYTITSAMIGVKYYIDLDGLCTGINVNSCFSFVQDRWSCFVFPNVDNINNSCFRGPSSFDRGVYGILSVPNSIPLGNTNASDGLFTYTKLENLYTDISNATNNGGSPDGDITNVNATIDNVNYSTNSTPPNAVSDLSVSATYGSAVSLSLSAPTSTNSVQYYLVFANNVYHSFGSGSSINVSGLELSTAYDFKVITLDEMGNISGFSNTASTTTLSSYQIPTGNIISYWNFDSNSNDQVGSNNGTDANISYVSGLISNSASFNGSSSKITIPDDDTLSFPSVPFSISCWVYMDSTASNQFFYGKRTSTLAEYQLGYVSGELRWRLFGGTTSNVLQFNQSYALSASTWHHIVITYDNTDLKLYVNKVNVPVTQTTSGTFSGSVNTSASLIFGQDFEGSTNWFDGLQDEFSIFDTDLSEIQVVEIHAKNIAGLYLTE